MKSSKKKISFAGGRCPEKGELLDLIQYLDNSSIDKLKDKSAFISFYEKIYNINRSGGITFRDEYYSFFEQFGIIYKNKKLTNFALDYKNNKITKKDFFEKALCSYLIESDNEKTYNPLIIILKYLDENKTYSINTSKLLEIFQNSGFFTNNTFLEGSPKKPKSEKMLDFVYLLKESNHFKAKKRFS